MRLRPLVRRVHFILTATLGLLVVLAGVSGSVLVFRAEIDAALNPELLRVEPGAAAAPLAEVVEAAREAVPDAVVGALRMPRRTDEPVEVWMRTPEEPEILAYVDPYSARVLGHRGAEDSAMGWLFHLHAELLAGETGALVVGLGGIALLLLALSGLWLWWPRRGKLHQALTLKRGAKLHRRLYDLHRAGGFYTLPLLVLLAVTGLSLIFYVAFQNGLNQVTGSPDRPGFPVVSPPPDGSLRPLDELTEAAERVLPEGEVSWLLLPAAPEAPFLVRKQLPGELHPNGKSFVAVDPYTAAVLEVRSGPGAPLGWRLYDVLYPLHIGHWGGLASRILYALVGLVPLFLAVTGLVVWRRRNAPRRSAPAAPSLRPRPSVSAHALPHEQARPRRLRPGPHDRALHGVPPAR